MKVTIVKALFGVGKTLLTQSFLESLLKVAIIEGLTWLAKSTKNTVDDKMVEDFKEAMENGGN